MKRERVARKMLKLARSLVAQFDPSRDVDWSRWVSEFPWAFREQDDDALDIQVTAEGDFQFRGRQILDVPEFEWSYKPRTYSLRKAMEAWVYYAGPETKSGEELTVEQLMSPDVVRAVSKELGKWIPAKESVELAFDELADDFLRLGGRGYEVPFAWNGAIKGNNFVFEVMPRDWSSVEKALVEIAEENWEPPERY